VLVGDVEDLDRPAVSGLVEEEVERPDLVGADSGDRSWRPGAFLRRRVLRGTCRPSSRHNRCTRLRLHCQPPPLQQHVHTPVAVAGMTTCEQAQPLPQHRLVSETSPLVTLRGAMLPRSQTRPALRDPETALQMRGRRRAGRYKRRGVKLPRMWGKQLRLGSQSSHAEQLSTFR
jgi:hypothetical protein